MLYMIIEHYRNGPGPVYERFRARGRLAPEGLTYINSWVTPDLQHCYQVMESGDTLTPRRLDGCVGGPRRLRGASGHLVR